MGAAGSDKAGRERRREEKNILPLERASRCLQAADTRAYERMCSVEPIPWRVRIQKSEGVSWWIQQQGFKCLVGHLVPLGPWIPLFRLEKINPTTVYNDFFKSLSHQKESYHFIVSNKICL